MQKTILSGLIRAYLRTFPPIAKNGNNMIGDAKRAIIALLINAVGGKKLYAARRGDPNRVGSQICHLKRKRLCHDSRASSF